MATLFHGPKPGEKAPVFTVTFDANGVPGAQTVNEGSSITLPGADGLVYTDKTFTGWNTSAIGTGTRYAAGSQYTPTGNVTLYVQWGENVPGNLSLDEALTWISGNADDGAIYIITVKQNETLAPKTLSYDGKNIGVTLKGESTERKVSLSSNGSLFTVGSGVTLTLEDNITLQGTSNTASMVMVSSGGGLVMNGGSKISGNTFSSSSSSRYGGGVHISSGGTFTMNGGTISGNTSSSSYSYYGGGVYVSGGAFTMNGGIISGNASSSGGGVYVSGGAFTMNGGIISGNASSSSSGGGGGVYVFNSTFTMKDGTISGNTASSGGGGGVYVLNSTFTMRSGTISGNTSRSGGGVYVYSNGTFTKQSDGTIYGSEDVLKNTATQGDSYGHAVYASTGSKKRNTTAGVGVTMDSSKSGAAGGWQ
jgi:hypothetical protein